MRPLGFTVGDVGGWSRRRGYGSTEARRSCRQRRCSRSSGLGRGRGSGDGGASSSTGDNVVGLSGFRVGGSDGEMLPVADSGGAGFVTTFGKRMPYCESTRGGVLSTGVVFTALDLASLPPRCTFGGVFSSSLEES
ncbi:uncharacterized protein IUM83_11000 [Phytophthora cinnamomi]|uniref:uncharacterized protein n=1 Tax=Phytophthora cinnamomi TaxID=4785 RepID=UPI003559B809|nr:hypothetical protein IUM83_11000 [Phytophthora cinnamomi]